MCESVYVCVLGTFPSYDLVKELFKVGGEVESAFFLHYCLFSSL